MNKVRVWFDTFVFTSFYAIYLVKSVNVYKPISVQFVMSMNSLSNNNRPKGQTSY